MSEKREPGYYVVKLDGRWTFGEQAGGFEGLIVNGSLHRDEVYEEIGPRILPSPNLVQVPREELLWLRRLHDAVRDWSDDRTRDALDRLDSLRRREGESS